MKALSVRAPWWWFILYLGKLIENRDWFTHYRGPVLLHASKWFSAVEVCDDWAAGIQMYRRALGAAFDPSKIPPITLRDMKALGGHVVGQVEIVDSVSHHSSPWFVGKYGFVLQNPIVLPNPFPAKGALGLFDVASQEDRTDAPLLWDGCSDSSSCPLSTCAHNSGTEAHSIHNAEALQVCEQIHNGDTSEVEGARIIEREVLRG